MELVGALHREYSAYSTQFQTMFVFQRSAGICCLGYSLEIQSRYLFFSLEIIQLTSAKLHHLSVICYAHNLPCRAENNHS
jgi:hypothetical protein